MVRTTLNLDDDVAAALTEMARRSGRSVSRVANEVLRLGLAADRPRLPRYDPPRLGSGTPLVDVTDVAGALELLERG